MLIQKEPPLHLTYCLNIHKGESWPEVLRDIREHALDVKARIGKSDSFGLGLRLSYEAACVLHHPEALAEFLSFLTEHQLYVPTINGFPYGSFHGASLKENVYAPDWRSEKRRDYTITLARILRTLLPEDVSGSISTVPCAFRSWIKTDADKQAMTVMLAQTVASLARIEEQSGRCIHLGLEPEPGCYIESTTDFIAFYRDFLLNSSDVIKSEFSCSAAKAEELVRRHLGVCVDCCHVAVAFADLNETLSTYLRAGIRISKVQLSAGLEVDASAVRALKDFADPTYLHQTALLQNGQRISWLDLPDALNTLTDPEEGVLRVHYHVPLAWSGSQPFRSTRDDMSPAFFARLREGVTGHAEIETYTFHHLPHHLASDNVVDSIVSEYQWVLEQLGASDVA